MLQTLYGSVFNFNPYQNVNIKNSIMTPYTPINGQLPFKAAKKFIIDCDCGPDDAHALILAFHMAKKLNKEILGITCVAGNTYLENCLTNTGITLSMLKQKVPFYKGAHTSLLLRNNLQFFFGQDGFSGYQNYYVSKYPNYNRNFQAKHAIDFLIDSIKENPGEISLILTGPLTNLALAVLKCPEIAELVNCIYIMGGTYNGKGDTPNFTTEFNAFTDPEAYYTVFNSFRRIVLLPYDSMFEIQPNEMESHAIFNQDSEKGKFVRNIYQMEKLKAKTVLLVDPLTVAVAMHEESVTSYINKWCEIELSGRLTYGQVVVDWLNSSGKTPNVYIPNSYNKKIIFNLLKDMLKDDKDVANENDSEDNEETRDVADAKAQKIHESFAVWDF